MSDRGFDIDVFKPSDAPAVGQLFKDVYGDGYPVKTVYHPEQLVSAFQNGDYIPVVARAQDGRIVGYTAMYRSAPHRGLYEAGQALVAPEYRKTGVAGLLFRHTMRAAPMLSGIEAIFCEAVCNHTHVQKAGILFKYIETAMEIDLMPDDAYDQDKTGSGRVSTLDMFRTYVPNPHTIYVPEVYEECLRYVYEGFDDHRTLVPSRDRHPSQGSTEMATQVFDFARLARVNVHQVGRDFATVLDAELDRLVEKHFRVIQVWLRLSWPWVGETVRILRDRCFFFGGALPRWFDEDGLLMQKVLGQPNWEGINLHTDRAKQILCFIKDDWKTLAI
jgi:hypothetical protein